MFVLHRIWLLQLLKLVGDLPGWNYLVQLLSCPHRR
jgi:hypothetical protein